MPAPVRAVIAGTGPRRPTGKVSDGWSAAETVSARMVTSVCQARTQAPSWRARPSTSSRRRLTAATRSDHHRSLRSIPR